jgi:hypothetical protein
MESEGLITQVFLMLIPGHEDYDYVYDFETKTDTIQRLKTGNFIKFSKQKSVHEYDLPTGKRRRVIYVAKLNGRAIQRGWIRATCLVPNPYPSHWTTTIVAINGNGEDDSVENLAYVNPGWMVNVTLPQFWYAREGCIVSQFQKPYQPLITLPTVNKH